MTKIYRQGDVLLLKIDKIPGKKRKIKSDIIAKGEVTGHAHRILNGSLFWGPTIRLSDGTVSKSRTTMYLDAKKGAQLIHDEHGPIDIESGVYEVRRQREYNGIDREFREVVD